MLNIFRILGAAAVPASAQGVAVNPSGSGSHWMAMLDLPGCVAGIDGGFYCFALNP